MYYTIYKITNLINNKIYIGCHKTNDLNDDYMGSGIYIRRSIEKHGIENFTKEYISVFDNEEEMFEMESILVNEEFVERKDTYNLKAGGSGGFDYIHKNGLNIPNGTLGGQRFKERMNVDIEFKDKIIKSRQKSMVEQYKLGTRVSIFKDYNFQMEMNSRSKTPESRAKRIETLKKIEHSKGEKNSQYGTMWVTNGIESKKIKKDSIIELGWRKGRTLNITKRTISSHG